jgi:hypothetical protein
MNGLRRFDPVRGLDKNFPQVRLLGFVVGFDDQKLTLLCCSHCLWAVLFLICLNLREWPLRVGPCADPGIRGRGRSRLRDFL